MRPERIVILGNAGSGKSTLSRILGAKTNYPVAHLDRLFWGPQWTKPEPAAFRARVSDVVNTETWISEGNYPRRTFDLRIPAADLIVWMDTPRIICLFRVLMRSLRNQKRSDLPDGCTEKINAEFFAFLHYIWKFESNDRPKIERLRLEYGPEVPVIHLKNKRQIEQFLSSL
ncbi:hypothetical protein [Erwinia sp. S38]|uniref:hypothetical protein n=1 Tax=Erwinia sp. S38 TaxID=2769338 RepID=UPI00190D7BEE|nr:hypothetical protein [Erwinia sp. S38]MBK0002691.1 AAA family ATPase [Erwinia sp. S38]